MCGFILLKIKSNIDALRFDGRGFRFGGLGLEMVRRHLYVLDYPRYTIEDILDLSLALDQHIYKVTTYDLPCDFYLVVHLKTESLDLTFSFSYFV